MSSSGYLLTFVVCHSHVRYPSTSRRDLGRNLWGGDKRRAVLAVMDDGLWPPNLALQKVWTSGCESSIRPRLAESTLGGFALPI